MIGVNTPETHHPTKPVEPYGPEAEKFTRSQLEGRQVWLEKDVQERDKYKRMLAYIWMQQPLNNNEVEIRKKMFNAQLLLDGYAQVMTVPPNVKYAEVFVKLQKEARENKRGLWGIADEKQSQNLSRKNGPGPNGETIKGNINSRGEKIYHVPGGKYYEQTVPEEWFFTEEEAQKAGYRKSTM
ncbi:MAG: thermonuclease family protein [Desulfotomaculum sp.]|nr:thermonuclease family protein [Desulfotomaculum sp.]